MNFTFKLLSLLFTVVMAPASIDNSEIRHESYSWHTPFYRYILQVLQLLALYNTQLKVHTPSRTFRRDQVQLYL